MKARNLLDSFNYAFDGIVYAFKTQRNIRLHFLAAAGVLSLSLFLKIDKHEILILFLAIALVIVAEMINTAIEATVDLVTQETHPLAAIAKNVAAGAVLAASVAALLVGYLIFFPKIDVLIPRVIIILQQTPSYLTLVAFFLTMLLVIVGKTLTRKGRPLKGGMPSGHTALATSAATIILFLARNSLSAVLAYFLVFLVAQSRLEGRIHTLNEIIAGAMVGFLATLTIFQFILW